MSPELETVTNQTKTPVYNATAPQSVEFEMNGIESPVAARVSPISDEVYLSVYEPKAATRIVDNGSSLVTDSNLALAALFDAVVQDLTGIPGDKPENWKEALDGDQVKAPVMSRVLAVACYDEPFKWGQTSQGVACESYFNNEIVTGRHFLRKKSPDDVRAYRNLQKIPLAGKGKGLSSGDIYISPNTRKKAAIYDKMQERTAEGYENGVVPIWHKAAVVDHIFASSVTAKK